MRNLKFRIWSKIKNAWLNSCVIGESGKPLLFYVEVDDNNVVHNKVYTIDNLDPVIQQYTGLQDLKGKEIYEGDILRVSWECDKKMMTKHAKVIWDNQGMFATEYLDWVKINSGKDDGKPVGGFIIPKESEIIGNIFENPELLKN